MIYQFKELKDMKKFAKFLSVELAKNGYKDLAIEVDMFSSNSYTTSSEYLGEFRIILKNVIIETNNILEKNMDLKKSISIAIDCINRAFRN